uniref:Uncharacterized protein n=1 Tax=Physcomitrium patens TaxID=3218 RepID=A0A2K1KXE7_PHYPA|nr:hypothetical protein PHYPA_005460 [Physcomitrium patens]
MQRHWETRRDVEHHLWLAEHRPTLALLAPSPPHAKMAQEEKMTRRKEDVDGLKANTKQYYSNRCIDDLIRSGGREFNDLFRSFSKLDVNLQKLLIDAMAKHLAKKEKDLEQKDVLVEREGRKPTLAWFKVDNETRPSKNEQHRRRRCTSTASKPHPPEDRGPCSCREWPHSPKQQKICDGEEHIDPEKSRVESILHSSGGPK